MSPAIAQAWKEVDDMLCDAIPDHAKRRAISEKIASIQTAERFAIAEQLEGMERRIQIALLGAGEEAGG